MTGDDVSLLCVRCVELVGVERAEWAAVYEGDSGYCPEHLPQHSGDTSGGSDG